MWVEVEGREEKKRNKIEKKNALSSSFYYRMVDYPNRSLNLQTAHYTSQIGIQCYMMSGVWVLYICLTINFMGFVLCKCRYFKT